MLKSRTSSSAENPDIKSSAAGPEEKNSAWLARVKATEGLILLGGTSVSHFRVRVAQCHMRRDLLPSFWSLAGVLQRGVIHTVDPDRVGAAEEVLLKNGVQSHPISDYDDPAAFPNIAVLRFATDSERLGEDLRTVMRARDLVDVPTLLQRWLGFIWSTDAAANPLLEGRGLPSAAMVETVYGLSRIDLTPGLSSSASCPEAIWHAAKWWRAYYEQAEVAAGPGSATQPAATTPSGVCAIRQAAAAARG